MSAESMGCDVWITDTKTGASRNLTASKGNSWAPVWSPDGNSLAFYSDRSGQAQLWVWEKSINILRPVSHAITHAQDARDVPHWTPDGKGILAKILPEGKANEAANQPPPSLEGSLAEKQRT